MLLSNVFWDFTVAMHNLAIWLTWHKKLKPKHTHIHIEITHSGLEPWLQWYRYMQTHMKRHTHTHTHTESVGCSRPAAGRPSVYYTGPKQAFQHCLRAGQSWQVWGCLSGVCLCAAGLHTLRETEWLKGLYLHVANAVNHADNYSKSVYMTQIQSNMIYTGKHKKQK